MNLHMILVVGFVFSVTGCTEKEQVMSEKEDEAPEISTVDVDDAVGNSRLCNESSLKDM